MVSADVLVVLTSNVSVGGHEYGPDYGTAVTRLPDRWARQFIRRGIARPAMRRASRMRPRLDGTVVVPVRVNPGRAVEMGGRSYPAGAVVEVTLPTADLLFHDGAAVPSPVGELDWSGVPVGEGLCGPGTPRCPNARSYYHTVRPCCRAILRELVRYVGRLLDAYGVTWWIDYGTLLGAIRNPLTTRDDYPWLRHLPEGPLPPGMLPHDKDADIGVLAQDADVVQLLQHVADEVGLGWKTLVSHGVKFTCSAKNATNLDAFVWYEKAEGVLFRHRYASVDQFKGKEVPRDLLFPLTEVEWEGLRVPAPRDPKLFLEMRYGPEWRTPVAANHDGTVR